MASAPRSLPAEAITAPPGGTRARRGRRRRPTGAAPALPRNIGWTTRSWAVLLAVVLVGVLVATRWDAFARAVGRVDAAILRGVAELRTPWLTSAARAVDGVASGWWMFGVGIALLVVLIVCRRWQHLFAFLGSVLAAELLGVLLLDVLQRPRPYDVTSIGDWQGFAMPSASAVIVSFTVVGVVFGTVVAGRPRAIAKAVGVAAVAVVVATRLYLAADHPTDVLVGVVIGTALPLLAFRFFAPNELFPVSYRRRRSAHLDIDARREGAIRHAVSDQLGLQVVDMAPIGLAGSGGSTPLRLRLDDGTAVFGKLYAMTHVRADRWYKTFRTMLYGRLEDEAPFQSVRRLVQQEDYALRVMRDAGIPTAAPLGVVELTPEREYLLVTEFFEGAEEIGDADVDDAVIDQGLWIVRQLWEAGLAHRDIKPANVLVRHGRVLLIDVAFAQVRPSPWREAVDLANMMLVLAVRTDPDQVYARAVLLFTPDEVAEAFAAARGIASPTQLRTAMRLDGRDLVGRFRALAPARRPISLQRWGPRRLLYLGALALAAFLVLPAMVSLFTPADLPVNSAPTCGSGRVMVLMAQSVPTATYVPCVTATPVGWDAGTVRVRSDQARFSLDSDEAGPAAVVVTLRPTCSTDGAAAERSDVPGMRQFTTAPSSPGGATIRSYVASGACVTVQVVSDVAGDAEALAAMDDALAFQPRGDLVRRVQRDTGLTLCGVSAPQCVGGPS